MSNKTYPLGSREAMKREPSLEEEDYVQDVELAMDVVLGKEFSLAYANLRREARLKALEDKYLEDSISEQSYDNNH